MKKSFFTFVAAMVLPVLVMAQGCPSSEPVTATVRLQFTVENMLEGEFSVSSSKRVNFSKGNLQYRASDTTWQFAAHQWDYIGNAAGNTTAEANRATQSNWIDLFGWATSGNPASNCEGYQPWYVPTTNAGHYGPGVSDGEWIPEHSDWGVVNAIQLGVGWRVLTRAEWEYLLNTRAASSIGATANVRYAKATLQSTIRGLILFPDEYTHPEGVKVPEGINTASSNSFAANTFNAEEWAKMEAAGCVFLPGAGKRNLITVSGGGNCYYWTSTIYSTSYVYSLYVQNSGVSCVSNERRHDGMSVRLVKDVVE